LTNTSAWETITFDQIKIGDKIRTVSKEPDGTKRTIVGTAKSKSTMWRAYYSDGGNTLVDADNKYLVSLERKRTDVFVLPKRVAAVVEAVRISSGETTRLVLADPEDEDKWHDVVNQSWMSDDEVKSRYRSHKVISKGVKNA